MPEYLPPDPTPPYPTPLVDSLPVVLQVSLAGKAVQLPDEIAVTFVSLA
jgi:hypothetical protein